MIWELIFLASTSLDPVAVDVTEYSACATSFGIEIALWIHKFSFAAASTRRRECYLVISSGARVLRFRTGLED